MHPLRGNRHRRSADACRSTGITAETTARITADVAGAAHAEEKFSEPYYHWMRRRIRSRIHDRSAGRRCHTHSRIQPPQLRRQPQAFGALLINVLSRNQWRTLPATLRRKGSADVLSLYRIYAGPFNSPLSD